MPLWYLQKFRAVTKGEGAQVYVPPPFGLPKYNNNIFKKMHSGNTRSCRKYFMIIVLIIIIQSIQYV